MPVEFQPQTFNQLLCATQLDLIRDFRAVFEAVAEFQRADSLSAFREAYSQLLGLQCSVGELIELFQNNYDTLKEREMK